MTRTKLVFLFVLIVNSLAISQTTRFNFKIGNTYSSTNSYSIKYSSGGFITHISSMYDIECSLSHPIISKDLGIYFGGHYNFFNIPFDEPGNPSLRLTGLELLPGIIVREPIGMAEAELIVCVGYSWERYNASSWALGSHTILNNNIIYVAGINMCFPFYDFMDATFGCRIRIKDAADITGSISNGSFEFKEPSVFVSGLIGLSFHFNSK
jgi:hypothetical protein